MSPQPQLRRRAQLRAGWETRLSHATYDTLPAGEAPVAWPLLSQEQSSATPQELAPQIGWLESAIQCPAA